MLSSCNFCHEPIPDQTAECPFCGEVNGVPGCTRHYFRQYYLAACPICQTKPLLRTDRFCPKCNVNLYQFSVEWGSSLRHADNATRFARKLANAQRPPGVVWEHLERKGRIRVDVDVGPNRGLAFSFASLCQYAGVVRGTECQHAGRSCWSSLPDKWVLCFLGYKQLVDVPEKLSSIAFDDSAWPGCYK